MNSLGETLKKERIRQGLEIKDIEDAISIRAFYLNAIEEGNYKVVPGEVYLKGFIRNYATHLGLDPQKMLEFYRQDKDTLPPEERLTEDQPLPAKSKEAAPQVRKYQRRREERRGEKKKSGSSLGKWLVVLLIAAGAIAWGAMNFFNLPIAPSPAAPPAQSEPAPSSPVPNTSGAVPSNPPPSAAQTPPATIGQTPPPTTGQTSPPTVGQTLPPSAVNPPTAAKNVTVAAKFNGRCWTQVNVDGKLEYEGTPKTGETLTFNGDQRIFIKFGNASAVELTHNGKALGIAGGPGEVLIKTFTKDDVTSVSSR